MNVIVIIAAWGLIFLSFIVQISSSSLHILAVGESLLRIRSGSWSVT